MDLGGTQIHKLNIGEPNRYSVETKTLFHMDIYIYFHTIIVQTMQRYSHSFILNTKFIHKRLDSRIPGPARAVNAMVMMKKINASTTALRRLMLCFAISKKHKCYELKHIRMWEPCWCLRQNGSNITGSMNKGASHVPFIARSWMKAVKITQICFRGGAFIS